MQATVEAKSQDSREGSQSRPSGVSRDGLGLLIQSLRGNYSRMAHIDQAVVTLGLFVYTTSGNEELVQLVYEHLASPSDPDQQSYKLHINRGIQIQERIIGLAPGDHENMALWLTKLSISYRNRFEHFGELEDIDRAICSMERAVSIPAEDDASSVRLNILGNLYLLRFECLGMGSDIDDAIDRQTRAVLLTPDKGPTRPAKLYNLACSYLKRCEHLGDTADIDTAILHYNDALALVSNSNVQEAPFLGGLGDAYSTRYGHSGELSDLDQAIKYQTQAVSLTSDENEDKPVLLDNLGSTYARRFGHSGMLSDIDQAIDCHERSILLTLGGFAERAARMDCLGIAYGMRFECSGEREDIDQAIELCTAAVEHAPQDHASKGTYLDNLGVLFRKRFERFGDDSDIEHALRFLNQSLVDAKDSSEATRLRLNNLGISYYSKFLRGGDILDIDTAINCQKRVVEMTPDAHNHKHTRYNNLGNTYLTRFERFDETRDLDHAIDCHGRAVELVPQGHRDRPTWLGNLGISYRQKFKCTRDAQYIEKAIECHAKALELTLEGEKFGILNLIGGSYQTRFERLGDLGDLDKAVGYYTQAIELYPSDHAERFLPLGNLGKSYLDRFKLQHEPSDLEKSIDLLTRAISATPDKHPYRATLLTDLGSAYGSRFERLKNTEDLDNSIDCLRRAVHSSAYPFARIHAANLWAVMASLSPDYIHSRLEAYVQLMSSIPYFIWLGFPISRRHYDIMTILGERASEAVAVAIACGELECAVEWFEEARSIVWRQMLQLRTPVRELRIVDPSLAQKVEQVASELDCAASKMYDHAKGNESETAIEHASQRHRRIAQEWTELLSQVRRVPGFESFLRPKDVTELARAAESSAVVMINVQPARCDALVLRPGSTVEHVYLAAFSHEMALNARKQLSSCLKHVDVRQRNERRPNVQMCSASQEGQFEAILGTLWEHVVKPVLEHLGHLTVPLVNGLPRITWCSTGPLAFLPLHAAGIYSGANAAKVFDYVISSYTPMLSALIPVTPHSIDFDGILAVGQANAKGSAPLPGTVTELAAVRAQSHQQNLRFTQLDGTNATSTAVLDAMKTHSWIHLACHATQNVRTPTSSAFILHDGPLNLSTIIQNSLTNKGLAFLSACQTATGDTGLPDEAVHLAAGMLMAGYPSVIGTMWSIKDQDAPKVAEHMYKVLFKGGAPDWRGSARALHGAVSRLRAELGEKAFARWVPYIHIGA